MKYSVLVATTAALALAACSESEAPAPDATASETAAATEAAAPAGPAAFTAGEAPSKEFLVGKWGEGPGCELAMTFNADGTITDGPTDKWTLTGDTLDLGGLFKMTLKVVDADTMTSKNEGGGEATLKRCA